MAAYMSTASAVAKTSADGSEGAQWERDRRAREARRRDDGAYELDGMAIGEGMRRASPKYVPREWMLAEAYEAAERG